MIVKEMEKIMAYLDKYLEQEDCLVLNMNNDGLEMYVEVLLYAPTEKYPFWKLITLGASDYKMPRKAKSRARRNEYMLFVDGSVDLMVPKTLQWYYLQLLKIASHAQFHETHLTAGDCVEWLGEEGSAVEGAHLSVPAIIQGGKGHVFCPRLFKKIVFLQALLATREELDSLRKGEVKRLCTKEGTPRFLSEKTPKTQDEN